MQAAVESFVLAATSDRCERAQRWLAMHPDLPGDRWVRLVLGRGWDGDANEVGGPRGWPPLHYLCHSCFEGLELAADLLDRGADPNVYFANEHGPISVLFGAAGVRHDPALTALLLEHGADPNGEPWFGDALYHSVESPDPACVRLLLEHGAEPNGSNALGHALDDDRPEHVSLLLAAGARPTGRELVHAVRRGRDPSCVRQLAEHGAELDQPAGEWSTPPAQFRTAYQNAYIRGREDLLAVLTGLGATKELRPGDAEVAAIARGERPEHPLPTELDHDQQEVLGLAALHGQLELVVALLGPDFFAHIGGGPPGTLLHHAAWVGDAAIVKRLLALGADPEAASGAEFDTPVAWAVLGSGAYRHPGRDYVGVVAALVAAGAELEPRFADVAQGPLAAWLGTSPTNGRGSE